MSLNLNICSFATGSGYVLELNTNDDNEVVLMLDVPADATDEDRSVTHFIMLDLDAAQHLRDGAALAYDRIRERTLREELRELNPDDSIEAASASRTYDVWKLAMAREDAQGYVKGSNASFLRRTIERSLPWQDSALPAGPFPEEPDEHTEARLPQRHEVVTTRRVKAGETGEAVAGGFRL